jgi:F-type H+-transporting ATPase subunit alpha
MHTVHPDVCKGIYDTRLDRKFPSAEIKSALENAIVEFNQTSNFAG